MARGRAARGSAGRKSAVGRRRAQQSGRDSPDAASLAYQDMLSEASASETARLDGARPLKKRRLSPGSPRLTEGQEHPVAPVQRLVQTAVDDSATSDESDVDWEQVDFDEDADANKPTAADEAAAKDISINLGAYNEKPSKTSLARRRQLTTEEKKMRLHIHKMHLCCLLTHVHIRNSWCNDAGIQATLKSLLSHRTISYLNPDVSLSQFQRSRSFMDGIEQACEAFRAVYEITTTGMKLPSWNAGELESEMKAAYDIEESVNKADFWQLAKDCEGSRDVGLQLFCALLRAAGVDARLVCSLQPLTFASPVPITMQPAKQSKPTVYVRSDDADRSADEISGSDSGPSTEIRPTTPRSSGPNPIRRFGASSTSVRNLGVTPPSVVKRKKTHESPFPVYWVEVFNTAVQKWLSVDPLVTKTTAKANKLEPPASDPFNNMSYVIAFEEDCTAKDVTRRYTKAYNAKTRKARVEVTKDGERWWEKVMGAFDNGLQADRDQVEDAELAQKEASEPMPRNVQDFKDHPYYALVRHLRRHEVIHPKKEVGKLSTGKSSDVLEPIFRRRDVQIVKSADKWYRTGRSIKPGEQPLKYSAPSRRRRGNRSPSPSSDRDQHEPSDTVGLYAAFQTLPYVPPPVVGGRVPRNAYGNIDLYVPAMIPPGGVHVRAAEAARAARLVGVDCADAVTGFRFKGRHGAAVTHGAVVARECAAAVEETVHALRWMDEEAERAKAARLALGMWKRFLVGLRIRQRVMAYGADEAAGDGRELREQVDEELETERAMQGQGGFLPDASAAAVSPARAADDGLDGNEASATALDLAASVATAAAENYRPPADTGPMCIPSPWDDEPTRHAPPAATDGSQGPSPTDTPMPDASDAGGGFIVPPAGDEADSGGGFMLPATSSATGSNTVGGLGASAARHETRAPENGAGGRHGSDSISPSAAAAAAAAADEDDLFEDREGAAARETTRSPSPADDDNSGATATAHGHAPRTHAQYGVDGAADARDAAPQMEAPAAAQGAGGEEPHATAPRGQTAEERATPGESGGEEGSLLSHDPDDEDAEPAWLAEDVRL